MFRGVFNGGCQIPGELEPETLESVVRDRVGQLVHNWRFNQLNRYFGEHRTDHVQNLPDSGISRQYIKDA